VGDEETARLAQTLYSLLPIDGSWKEINSLYTNNGRDPDTVQRVLHLIWDYGLINVR
jgi:hypothetical protein